MQGIIDLKYLAPPSDEVELIEHDPKYIINGEKEDAIRKIFYNVPFSQFEKEKIKELDAYLKKKKIKTPEFWNPSINLRFGYSCKFDMEKTAERLEKYFNWMDFQLNGSLKKQEFKFIDEGVIYLAGRDKKWRPVIILDLSKIEGDTTDNQELTNAICTFLCLMQRYCFVPGKVENWVFVIDTASKGFLNFPIDFIRGVLSALSSYFPSSLEKLYILDPSFTLKYGWKTIEMFIDARTAKKINFLDKDEYHKMTEYIAKENLQMRYGGEYPDIMIFWPPEITFQPDISIEDEYDEEEEQDNLEDLDQVPPFQNMEPAFVNGRKDVYTRNQPESPKFENPQPHARQKSNQSMENFNTKNSQHSFEKERLNSKGNIDVFDMKKSGQFEKGRTPSISNTDNLNLKNSMVSNDKGRLSSNANIDMRRSNQFDNGAKQITFENQPSNRSLQGIDRKSFNAGGNRQDDSFEFLHESQPKPSNNQQRKPVKVNKGADEDVVPNMRDPQFSKSPNKVQYNNSKPQSIIKMEDSVKMSQETGREIQGSARMKTNPQKLKIGDDDDFVVQETPKKSSMAKQSRYTNNTEENALSTKQSGRGREINQKGQQNKNKSKKDTNDSEFDKDDLTNSLGINEILAENADIMSNRVDNDIPDEIEEETERVTQRPTLGTSPIKTKQDIDEATVQEGRKTLNEIVDRYSTTTYDARRPPKKEIVKQKEAPKEEAPVVTKRNIIEWNKQKWMIPISDESDDEDDRGVFCGICISRKKKKSKK